MTGSGSSLLAGTVLRIPKPSRFAAPWSVEEQAACFVVRDQSGQALIKVTAVLQEYLRTALSMRTPHEQAATHGRRFRSRYESQAAAEQPRRRAQNQRRAHSRTGRRVARKPWPDRKSRSQA